jgi:FkbM family methyltransferase
MGNQFYWENACFSISDTKIARLFCKLYMSNPDRRYVFGCNSWGRSISEVIDIKGFIDDFHPDDKFNSLPVVRSSDAPKDALVVSAVVLGRPLIALQNLNNAGLQAIDYYAFEHFSGLKLLEVPVLNSFKQEYLSNRVRYRRLYGLLADRKSQEVFADLIEFRISKSLASMQGYQDLQEHQYFEHFLTLTQREEVFVDCGCYNGYTSEYFAKICAGYKAIHVLEPIPTNMQMVMDRLSKLDRVYYHPYGAADREDTLRFRSSGSSSGISSDGDLEVPVKRIDDLVPSGCTFLKMDIEGGELPALRGAANTIRTYKPKLAISAYHKQDDLIRITDEVLSLNPRYRVYLRHYTQGVTETVLFFVD